MADDRKAEIELTVSGAERAAASARSSLAPWAEQAEKVKTAFGTLGGEARRALGGVVKDLASVITVGSSISFAGAVQQMDSFEKAASKLAVASGRSFDETKAKVEGMAKKLLASPEQVANYVNQVGQRTYDFSYAQKNMEAFNKFAKETGRELGSVGGLAGSFRNLGIENADKALRQLRGTAESLKTVGGPAALADQFTALSGTLQKASNSAPQLMALIGTLGKGLQPEQAAQVQQSVLGTLEGGANVWERHYQRTGALKKGEHLIDPRTGKVDVVRLAQMRQQEMLKRFGREGAMRRASGMFGGPQAAAAFLNADFGAMSGLTGQEADSDAAAKYAQTPGGKADRDAVDLAINMGKSIDSDSWLGRQRARFRAFTVENPLTSSLLTTVGVPAALKFGGSIFGKGLGGGGGAAVRGLMGMFTGGGGGKAAESAAEFALKNITGVGEKGALEMAPRLGGGLKGLIKGAGPMALVSMLMEGQFKALMEMGQAAKYKSGFASRDLTADEAAVARMRAGRAEAEARGERSEGMEDAAVKERRRVAMERGKQAGGTGQEQALAAFLAARQLGASSEEAENVARAVVEGFSRVRPQWTIVNQTGGPIEVVDQPGGEQ